MKIKQLFKTERFADSIVKDLKEQRNIVASKEKTEEGFEVSYDNPLKEIKASMDMEDPREMVEDAINSAVSYIFGEMQYALRYVHAEIDYLYEAMERHQEGHLPNVQGAEQMQRAISGLGLNEEYQVAKKTIYAEDSTWVSKNGTVLDSMSAHVTK